MSRMNFFYDERGETTLWIFTIQSSNKTIEETISAIAINLKERNFAFYGSST